MAREPEEALAEGHCGGERPEPSSRACGGLGDPHGYPFLLVVRPTLEAAPERRRYLVQRRRRAELREGPVCEGAHAVNVFEAARVGQPLVCGRWPGPRNPA
eukprot:9436551-Lingulodinium_polyedra.AAC.1